MKQKLQALVGHTLLDIGTTQTGFAVLTESGVIDIPLDYGDCCEFVDRIENLYYRVDQPKILEVDFVCNVNVAFTIRFELLKQYGVTIVKFLICELIELSLLKSKLFTIGFNRMSCFSTVID